VEGDQAFDLPLQLLVSSAHDDRLKVVPDPGGLLHDRLRIPAAGGTRRDQQDRPIRAQVIAPEHRFPVDLITQARSNRYSGNADPVSILFACQHKCQAACNKRYYFCFHILLFLLPVFSSFHSTGSDWLIFQ
jgi:hypothetical protein